MAKEKAYDFRKKLLTIHEKDVRDKSRIATADMAEISDGAVIEIGKTENEVIRTAAADFVDFLKVSMGVSATVETEGMASGKNVIRLFLADDAGVDLKEADGYKGFLIDTGDGIDIYGKDDRGVAAALYYIEDMMTMEKAPFLKRGEIRKKPLLAPLMVHSGYGLEEWPDEYLSRIAHEGRDAILVFTWDVNKTHVGYLDFNDLIARAARFGLDVYAYSFMINNTHPDDPKAEEIYDSLYGNLFRKCPGLKGVTFVGEVMEFHSNDPHVSKFCCRDKMTADLPDGLPWPGWYPCEDLPKWVELIKKIIRREKPDAELVLWSYNWGYQPEEARIKLIENLPTDIILQATYETNDCKQIGDAKSDCSDYSLSYVGPGPYFASEAAAAKKRGIRMHAMTQAAGTTWDFGLCPYEPMPYQWMRRYETMHKAIKDWGLCGAMDTHHHGFWPSIITKFSKHAFLTPCEPMEEILNKIFVSEYGEENLEKVQEGFKLWSEAINYYTPSEGDFTAASRVGPAYPFCLYYKAKPPAQENAFFGNLIVSPEYSNGMGIPGFIQREPRGSALNIKIHPELESLKKMHSLMKQGTAVFESIENKNEKLISVMRVGKFITNCVLTNIHAKEWHILKCKLDADFTREGMHKIADEMEALLHREQDNARATILLVEEDSRLGWEPTMLYLGDREHLEWKIRQVDYVLEKELVKLRKCIDF